MSGSACPCRALPFRGRELTCGTGIHLKMAITRWSNWATDAGMRDLTSSGCVSHTVLDPWEGGWPFGSILAGAKTWLQWLSPSHECRTTLQHGRLQSFRTTPFSLATNPCPHAR